MTESPDGLVTVVGYIWLATWLGEVSTTPWWIIALLITLGYAIVKLVLDIRAKKEKSSYE